MKARMIDHVVWAVPNLSAAAAAAEKAGFITTPMASHPPNMGTSNRLVQFGEHNFIEYLEVDRPQGIAEHESGRSLSFGAWNRDFLKRTTGVSMIVFATQDAQTDAREFAGKGLLDLETFNFGRRAVQPDGRELEAAFELAFAVDKTIDELACFTCHNRFPENFWKSDFQNHANGALGIEKIEVGGPSPQALAEYLGKAASAEIDERLDAWHLELAAGQEIVVRRRRKVAVLGVAVKADIRTELQDSAWGDCRLGLTDK